jgi:biotin carboxyl carrier protein
MKYVVRIGDRAYRIEILDEHHIRLDGQIIEVDLGLPNADAPGSLLVEGKSYEVMATHEGEDWQIHLEGHAFQAQVQDERTYLLNAHMLQGTGHPEIGVLESPMPGLVAEIIVSTGQKVNRGETLLILESMKMQNELRAPRDAEVLEIMVKAGDRVRQKQALVKLRYA